MICLLFYNFSPHSCHTARVGIPAQAETGLSPEVLGLCILCKVCGTVGSRGQRAHVRQADAHAGLLWTIPTWVAVDDLPTFGVDVVFRPTYLYYLSIFKF